MNTQIQSGARYGTPALLHRKLWLALVSGLSMLASASATNLAPDTNFRAPFFAEGVLPEHALLLPDGKYLLFFDPDTLTDQRTGAITRFLANGALDTTFNFSRDYRSVGAATAGANGKLYVAATRYAYGVKESQQILRLNVNGSIDTTFTPAIVGGPYTSQEVRQIIVQPDGKILVAGFFLTFGEDAARAHIVRLLANGMMDSSFAPVTINRGFLWSAALQADGKILIGGTFPTVNGVDNPGMARLNANGSLDSSFQADGFTRASTSQPIRAIAIQKDGKIVIIGQLRFGTGPGPRFPLFRLNTDGSADTNFTMPTNTPSIPSGRYLALQTDGKIVATINNSVYRFNTNGSLDSSFRQPVTVDTRFDPAGQPGTPITVDVLPDGRILVGGIFSDVDPAGPPNGSHFGVVRLNSGGTVDSTLVSSHRTGVEVAPSSFARLTDGTTLVTFADKIDPPIPYNAARLRNDGSLDPNFTLSSSDPNRLLSGFTAGGLEPLPDGNFFIYGTNASGGIVYGKVRPEGAEDTTFATNHAATFEKATAAPDGKIVVAAGTDAQSILAYPLARLQADGQIDLSFGTPVSVHNGQVIRGSIDNIVFEMYVGSRVLAIQSDGKVLYQYFTQDRRFHFVRLNADGSFDGTFAETLFTPTDLTESFPFIFDPQTNTTYQPPEGAWSATPAVQDAHIQADGRIIVTGHFTTFGNVPARGIVRLNADGTVDNTFNPGKGAQWTGTTESEAFFPTVENIEPEADGKFLVTGTFEAFNGVAAPGIASLNPNGSVDTSFVAPAMRDKYSRVPASLKRQLDGSFLLSGPYKFPKETLSPSLIRLIAPPMAVNISTRLAVGTGDNALIEGFIVQGPAGSSKKIMVRAIGPSLSPFGVTDALANPSLEIHDASNATVATNNDWKTTQVGGLITGNQSAAITASGLAPSNDAESAIIASLAPGNYTAVVRGVGNTVGTAVVDAFDLSAASPARLANIATRGLIQPGDKLMIAGFIVQNGPAKIVVSAIGPSLSAFGISNALPDTTLQLRNQDGVIVRENDNWMTTQKQELEQTGLQPTNNLEAALVETIQPGQYTAQVRGKGQASGIGVVQVYFLQ